MPLLAGTVSISGVGVASGAGLSKEIYDALVAASGMSPGANPLSVPGAQQQLAVIANVIAATVIAHFKTNALISVPSTAVATTGTAAAQSGTTTPAVATLT
jgi:hypothetical protein